MYNYTALHTRHFLHQVAPVNPDEAEKTGYFRIGIFVVSEGLFRDETTRVISRVSILSSSRDYSSKNFSHGRLGSHRDIDGIFVKVMRRLRLCFIPGSTMSQSECECIGYFVRAPGEFKDAVIYRGSLVLREQNYIFSIILKWRADFTSREKCREEDRNI